MTNNSFLDAAFDAVQEYRGRKGEVAREVSHFMTDDNVPLAYGLAYAQALESRLLDGAENRATPPEAVLGSMQDVMDKCCWNARRLFRANQRIDSGLGYDPSDMTAQTVGVYADNDSVESILKEDYKQMHDVFSAAISLIGYDTLQDLHLFNPSKYDETAEMWTNPYTSDTFDQAFEYMNEIADELAQKQADAQIEKVQALKALLQDLKS